MPNDIIVAKKEELTTLQMEKGISEILKPLTKEIFLFDTYVAGTTHLKKQMVLDTVKQDDKLILRREANKFDEMAILILDGAGEKLGYVPEKDNVVFARLMDAGKCLTAKVRSHSERNGFHEIRIGIFLVDF